MLHISAFRSRKSTVVKDETQILKKECENQFLVHVLENTVPENPALCNVEVE